MYCVEIPFKDQYLNENAVHMDTYTLICILYCVTCDTLNTVVKVCNISLNIYFR